MTIIPDLFGPRRCDSRYQDPTSGKIVPCGYDEFHTLHEDEYGVHRAYDSHGNITHSWMVSNVLE